MPPQFLNTPSGRRIAYRLSPGNAPTIVFLGGFMSDMDGTKAAHLETWARAHGRQFLRFDYSGHGQSSGAFTDGCIGDWTEDARAVINGVTDGPLILVGSSMGGWISLILAGKTSTQTIGMVGIATAPDFTEDSMWAGFTPAQRAQLMQKGRINLPSDYGAPYPITARLISDGRMHLVLRSPLRLGFPVRFLLGSADRDVSQSVALRLLEHADGDDIRLTLVKGADHRFSSPNCLALIDQTIAEVLARATPQNMGRN